MIATLCVLAFITLVLCGVCAVLIDRQKKLLTALEIISETQSKGFTVMAIQGRAIADHNGALEAHNKGAQIVADYMGETNKRLCDLERKSLTRDPRTGEVQH